LGWDGSLTSMSVYLTYRKRSNWSLHTNALDYTHCSCCLQLFVFLVRLTDHMMKPRFPKMPEVHGILTRSLSWFLFRPVNFEHHQRLLSWTSRCFKTKNKRVLNKLFSSTVAYKRFELLDRHQIFLNMLSMTILIGKNPC
jgi:hypothetical protein